MKLEKNILYSLFFKPVFVFFMALVLFYFAIKSSLENKVSLQQYNMLNSKLISLSSLAERLKMKRNSSAGFSDHSNESLNDTLMTLFNENSIAFKITYLQQNSILVDIENAGFSQLLNIFLMLSQDEKVEITNVNITFDKDNNNINGDIILLNKL
ncbi:type II secretion system protein GspM [Yersinia thracica]|nr:type II secretion system protein GspM [Yersinia thracica]